MLHNHWILASALVSLGRPTTDNACGLNRNDETSWVCLFSAPFRDRDRSGLPRGRTTHVQPAPRCCKPFLSGIPQSQVVYRHATASRVYAPSTAFCYRLGPSTGPGPSRRPIPPERMYPVTHLQDECQHFAGHGHSARPSAPDPRRSLGSSLHRSTCGWLPPTSG
jgi:hypothetical protein